MRVILPYHLRNLARVNGEVELEAQMPPEHGANTEEVLLELGYSWEEIGSLLVGAELDDQDGINRLDMRGDRG